MKRKLLIVVLALGSIAGFASGIFSMRCHARSHRSEMEERVTQICSDAIRQAQATAAPATPAANPSPAK